MNTPLNAVLGLRTGIALALLTMLFGFGFGGAFGAAEDQLKGYLDRQGKQVLDTVYAGDDAKRVATRDRAWTYFKRAHLHAGAMGTSALSMSILLAFLPSPRRLRWFASAALGLGGLGYSVFWLLAGLRTPSLGSTGAAKATLEWLALPSAGLFLIGTVLTLVLFLLARPSSLSAPSPTAPVT